MNGNDRSKATAGKFRAPQVTADGATRATVALTRFKTVWFNTGTLCNIACVNGCLDGNPQNDALEFISATAATRYFDELTTLGWLVEEIGFTGGGLFMNPGSIAMMEASLDRGFRVLVLTNAMKPMMRQRLQPRLKRPVALYGDRLTPRVSLDHWQRAPHGEIRGAGSFVQTVEGHLWLCDEGLWLLVAGRALWGIDEAQARRLRRFLRPPRVEGRRPRSCFHSDLSRGEYVRRDTRDHHGLLGDPRQFARRRDVRVVADGGETPGPPGLGAGLYPDCPRQRLRTWRNPGRGRPPGGPRPLALRDILRAGRWGLFGLKPPSRPVTHAFPLPRARAHGEPAR